MEILCEKKKPRLKQHRNTHNLLHTKSNFLSEFENEEKHGNEDHL